MTKILEEAFHAAQQLAPEEQDALGKALLADLQSEREWERTFASSKDALEALAAEALAEHRAGRTERMGCDDD